MKTESPFKDRPGFLTFEEFYLLTIGTPVETVDGDGVVRERWTRGYIRERGCAFLAWSPHSGGMYLGDAGILPYPSGSWNGDRYTRLPLPKPQPPSELDKLRQELKAARDTVERLAVQIEEMSK